MRLSDYLAIAEWVDNGSQYILGLLPSNYKPSLPSGYEIVYTQIFPDDSDVKIATVYLLNDGRYLVRNREDGCLYKNKLGQEVHLNNLEFNLKSRAFRKLVLNSIASNGHVVPIDLTSHKDDFLEIEKRVNLYYYFFTNLRFIYNYFNGEIDHPNYAQSHFAAYIRDISALHRDELLFLETTTLNLLVAPNKSIRHTQRLVDVLNDNNAPMHLKYCWLMSFLIDVNPAHRFNPLIESYLCDFLTDLRRLSPNKGFTDAAEEAKKLFVSLLMSPFKANSLPSSTSVEFAGLSNRWFCEEFTEFYHQFIADIDSHDGDVNTNLANHYSDFVINKLMPLKIYYYNTSSSLYTKEEGLALKANSDWIKSVIKGMVFREIRTLFEPEWFQAMLSSIKHQIIWATHGSDLLFEELRSYIGQNKNSVINTPRSQIRLEIEFNLKFFDFLRKISNGDLIELCCSVDVRYQKEILFTYMHCHGYILHLLKFSIKILEHFKNEIYAQSPSGYGAGNLRLFKPLDSIPSGSKNPRDYDNPEELGNILRCFSEVSKSVKQNKSLLRPVAKRPAAIALVNTGTDYSAYQGSNLTL